ncbi:MAG TPA: sulfite exporter TauE/SafE family protein [Actinomycetes bacterium]|nr:sulfite exporter TauE/SafE family protein [Actinomycetes bacterium]
MLVASELVLSGLVIGLMLGVLGGGGAIFTAPLLVYVFDVEPLTATTVSLVVVLLAASSGLVSHARAHRVRWRDGLLFGLVGTVGAAAGSVLAGWLPERALMGGFAVLLLAAAYAMWRPPVRSPGQSHRSRWPAVVATALLVGLVTGVFGVGGGFVIVPALVLVLGFSMPAAAATGLLVIGVNALAALAVRGPAYLDWDLALPMAAGAVVGSAVGSQLSRRFQAVQLQRGFAALMVATAAFVAVQVGVA